MVGMYGSIHAAIGPSACQKCPSGSTTYYNASVLNDCICMPGLTRDDKNSNCTTCLPGTFKIQFGDNVCDKCPVNTYSHIQGLSGTCSACPIHSQSQIGSSGIHFCKCTVGYTGKDGGECTACLPGSYKDTVGNATCTRCKRGLYSSYANATSKDVCVECKPFSYSNIGSTDSNDCICNRGYFLDHHGSCVDCPPGTYKMANGSSACTECQNNTFSTHHASFIMETCQECPIYSISDSGSDNISKCTCMKGTTGYNGENCIMCSAGKYKSVVGSSQCTVCNVGKYSDTIKATNPQTCLQCPQNTNSGNGTSTKNGCICIPGTTGVNGYACTECPPGTYKYDTGDSLCINCGAGTYSTTTQSTKQIDCLGCPENTFSPAGSSMKNNCSCNAGSVGMDGESCVLCIAGTYKRTSGTSVCTKCSAGKYSTVEGAIFNVCQSCPVNSNSTVGSDRILDCICNAGSTGINGSSCTLCKAGKYKILTGDSPCVDCDSGQYLNTTGSQSNLCKSCPNYSNSLSGSGDKNDCICNAGSTGLHGSICKLCQTGTYKETKGSHECTLCLSGKYSVDLGSVSDTCQSCPPNSNAPAGSDQHTDCTCNSGATVNNANNTGCSLCVPGKYKINIGDAPCTSCTNGTYSNQTGSNDINTCVSCHLDSTSDMGSISNRQCICNKGFTGVDGETCNGCASGTYKENIGSSICILCAISTYSTVVNSTTEENCNLCPPYSSSHIGSVKKTDCVCKSGYIGENGDNCVACPPGLYKSQPGNTQCVECESGRYSNKNGSIICIRCPVHTYSRKAAISVNECTCNIGYTGDNGQVCSACAYGTYKNTNGSSVCTQCKQNANTTNPAAADPSDCVCDAGFHGNYNQTECIACEIGEYRYFENETCITCPTNTTTIAIASKNVKECICMVGFFENNNTGQQNNTSRCIPCPFDTYNNESGQEICKTCPVLTKTLQSTSISMSDCKCISGYVGNSINGCYGSCDEIDLPAGYEFDDECNFVNINECERGISNCDILADCVDLVPHETTTNVGYGCVCGSNMFIIDVENVICSGNGLVITIFMLGEHDQSNTSISYSAIQNTLHRKKLDFDTISLVRLDLLHFFVENGYTTNNMSIETLYENIKHTPVSHYGVQSNGRFIFSMTTRIPYEGISIQKFQNLQGELLNTSSTIYKLLNGGDFSSNYNVKTKAVCQNDVLKTCSSIFKCRDDTDCLENSPHIEFEMINVKVNADLVSTVSNGMEIQDIEYSITSMQYTTRIRYNTKDSKILNFVYLSRSASPVKDDDFLCTSPQKTLCCLQNIAENRIITSKLSEMIFSTLSNLACEDTNESTLNNTSDFVEGIFSGMSERSYALIDTILVDGYVDVIVYLAEEDIQLLMATKQENDDSYNLEFSIGVGNIRNLQDGNVAVEFASSPVSSTIGDSFIFTTPSKTDIKETKSGFSDLIIDLVEVWTETYGYQKFMKITLVLEHTMPENETPYIIETEKIVIKTGYSPDIAILNPNSCSQIYTGQKKIALDDAVNSQKKCFINGPVCQTIGVDNIYFLLIPLHSEIWDTESNQVHGMFEQKLFLNFVARIFDADNRELIVNVQKILPISNFHISSTCKTVTKDANINTAVSVSVLLGLTHTFDWDRELTFNLDILDEDNKLLSQLNTSDSTSTIANTMTVIISGDAAVFEQEYASDFSVQVEDIVTIHVIDDEKYNSVTELINTNNAFIDGTNNIELKDLLLSICPPSHLLENYGCFSRFDLTNRNINNMKTASIAEISDIANSTNLQQKDALSSWLQGNVDTSDYILGLGHAHSKIVSELFNLNSRYRKAYLLAPTVQWKQSEINKVLGYTSSSNTIIPQHTIVAIMISIDTGILNSPTRRLLQFGASEDNVKRGVFTRESIGRKNSIHIEQTQQICDKTVGRTTTCALLALNISLSSNLICSPDITIVQNYKQMIHTVITETSNHSIMVNEIFTVHRPDFKHFCVDNITSTLDSIAIFYVFTQFYVQSNFSQYEFKKSLSRRSSGIIFNEWVVDPIEQVCHNCVPIHTKKNEPPIYLFLIVLSIVLSILLSWVFYCVFKRVLRYRKKAAYHNYNRDFRVVNNKLFQM